MKNNYIYIFMNILNISNILYNICIYLEEPDFINLFEIHPRIIQTFGKLNISITINNRNCHILKFLKNLREVDLFNQCDKIINLKKLFINNKYINKIILPKYTNHSDIIKMASCITNLTEIDLSVTRLSEDSLKYIFLTNFRIKKIYFPRRTTDSSLYYLGLYNNYIELISLRYGRITDIGIYYLCKNNSNIKYLDLYYCRKITNKSIDYLKNNQIISIELRYTNIDQNSIIEIINPQTKCLSIKLKYIKNLMYHLMNNQIQLKLLYIDSGMSDFDTNEYRNFFIKINKIEYLWICDFNITTVNIFTLISENRNLNFIHIISNIDRKIVCHIYDTQKNIKYIHINYIQYFGDKYSVTMPSYQPHIYHMLSRNYMLFKLYSNSYNYHQIKNDN